METPGDDVSVATADPLQQVGNEATADELFVRSRGPFSAWSSPSPSRLVDRFLFSDALIDPELGRRARLIAWFGFLGFFFGMLYAVFYFSIGHNWGAGIVSICSLGFLGMPFVMRAQGAIWFAGNFLVAVTTLGFTALCGVEGGLNGHAVAWLSSVPLCALLLMGKKSAGVWGVISFAAAAAIFAVDLLGIKLPVKYDFAWHSLVNAAGYLGLIAFLFALGLIFEVGREQAFAKMTGALQDLANSNDKLNALNQEKSEFLGIAAHDLRNPLTIIINYAELLEEGGATANTPKFAKHIYAAGTRMRDLIMNLLDAQAIEEGRFSCRLEKCDVAQLIAESVTQNQINASRKGTEVVTEIARRLYANVDRGTAVQILDNLISNAVKYSPPRSQIRIRASQEFNQVMISVKDQGPGLSAEDQTKLFGRFARLSAQPTGGESSTGLGLSIVKRLVEAMKGSIECQSVFGHGAIFTVRLPIWNEGQIQAQLQS